MSKILVMLLMLIASIGGGVYYLNSQNKPVSKSPEAPKIVSKVTPTPNITTLSTSDASIDTDLTALDKDLAGLELSDTDLTKDINGI